MVSVFVNCEFFKNLLVAQFIHALYSAVKLTTKAKIDHHFTATCNWRFNASENAVVTLVREESFQLGLFLVNLWKLMRFYTYRGPQTYQEKF